MKLSDLRPKTYKLEIVHPEIGDTGIVFELVSMQSKAYSDKIKSFVKDEGDIDLNQLTDEQKLEFMAKRVSASVVGWTGIEDLEYSEDAVKTLVTDPDFIWLVEILGEALSKRSNFFRKPVEQA